MVLFKLVRALSAAVWELATCHGTTKIEDLFVVSAQAGKRVKFYDFTEVWIHLNMVSV